MNKLIFILLLFPLAIFSQTDIESNKEISKSFSSKEVEDFNFDIKNPLKASLYSAVLPGLGQVYNEKIWKVPVVWGAIGTSVGFTLYYNNLKNKYRSAFIAELNGEKHQYSGILDASRLGRIQNDLNRKKDYAIVITALVYIFNVIDALVDAHLYEIKKDSDLSIDPMASVNSITEQNEFGLSLKFNLK